MCMQIILWKYVIILKEYNEMTTNVLQLQICKNIT